MYPVHSITVCLKGTAVIIIMIIIIIVMEIYAVPKLSKYMTALGTYNVKSFTHEINQHMREYTHAHTHTHRG